MTRRLPPWLRLVAPGLLLAFLPALSGCSVAPPMPDPGADHPASPQAATAPAPEPSSTLQLPQTEEKR